MDLFPRSVRRPTIAGLSRIARSLREAGFIWESWYVLSEVVAPLLPEAERDDWYERELGGQIDVEPLHDFLIYLDATPRRSYEGRRVEIRTILSDLRFPAPGSLKAFSQLLRCSAGELALLGDYRSAVRAGLLAPMSFVLPVARHRVLDEVWKCVSEVEKTRIERASELSHLAIDAGYPAISASVVARAIADLRPSDERIVWKALNRDVFPVTVGREGVGDVFGRVIGQAMGTTRPLSDRDLALLADELATGIEVREDRIYQGVPGSYFGDDDAAPPPPPPPSPAPAAPAIGVVPPPDPEFYFTLEGEDVAGARVKAGTDFDLIFNYDVPPVDSLGTVRGERLERLRKDNKDLDIWLTTAGVTIRDGVSQKVARFRGGRLDAPVRFALRAHAPTDTARLLVVFMYENRRVYTVPIRIRVVSELDASSAPRKQPLWDLDAEDLEETVARRAPREATLFVWASGEALHASLRLQNRTEQVAPHLDNVSLTSLGSLMLRLKDQVQPAAEHLVWTAVKAFDAAGPEAAADVLGCLERVATAGSDLYQALSGDPDLKKMIDAIDQLPDGSHVRIETNKIFLPWEVMYPSSFSFEWPPETRAAHPIDPRRFWGSRFIIESRLLPNQPEKTPPSGQQEGCLHVSMNVNLDIDTKFPGRQPPPAASHVVYYDDLAARFGTGIGDLQRTGEAIKQRLLATDNAASLIYLYCHGENDLPFQAGRAERLQLDGRTVITPKFLNDGGRYSGRPVVVINSCGSGAFTPLAFSTFLSEFQRRGAVGLIPTTFPVPATFAADFGQRLIERYISGESVGQALWLLRREALQHQNPLGLFYTLQCDLETTAPGATATRAA